MTDDVLGSANDDEQTADEALGHNPDVEDITNDPTPDDFDFDAFVDGVRPGRRAVRVTMRADLAAEIDRIAIQADELDDHNGDEAQALFDRFEDIKEQIQASQRVFVVEARSDHRTRQTIKQMEKLGHPQPGKKADDDEVRLQKLSEVAEAEVNKLFGALHEVNTNPTKSVAPNLSRRR